jgi:protocatechuate 3,4-dioxygenase beta subunit
MYFPGEPLNDSDRILALAGANRARLIAAATPAAARQTPLLLQWDIVLRGG